MTSRENYVNMVSVTHEGNFPWGLLENCKIFGNMN